MHIALAGPCTPGRLGHRLDHDEREAPHDGERDRVDEVAG